MPLFQFLSMDQLAASGLRFNNFHATALCSPTRNALKTGRNHHTTNTGSIMETATAFPGNTGQIPNSVAPLAEMLRLNGYSTGAFGKWHETTAWETSVSGPFDRWPTHQGFDKFYAALGRLSELQFSRIFLPVTQKTRLESSAHAMRQSALCCRPFAVEPSRCDQAFKNSGTEGAVSERN